MSNLELLIRPFQTRDITPPKRILKPNAVPPEDVVIIISEEGSSKTFSGSFNQTVSTYQDATIKEKERKTSKKTIKNPDDEDQHLDVELIDKLTTKQGSGKYFQKSVYKFENKE